LQLQRSRYPLLIRQGLLLLRRLQARGWRRVPPCASFRKQIENFNAGAPVASMELTTCLDFGNYSSNDI